jgi:hypothetical protein
MVHLSVQPIPVGCTANNFMMRDVGMRQSRLSMFPPPRVLPRALQPRQGKPTLTLSRLHPTCNSLTHCEKPWLLQRSHLLHPQALSPRTRITRSVLLTSNHLAPLYLACCVLSNSRRAPAQITIKPYILIGNSERGAARMLQPRERHGLAL